ncbi:MAG: PilZ domain-containing protein, partial [Myxococcota bacterium]
APTIMSPLGLWFLLGLAAAVAWAVFAVQSLSSRVSRLEIAIRRFAPDDRQIGGTRVGTRIPVVMDCFIRVDNREFQARTSDLSVSGAQIFTDFTLNIGMRVWFRFDPQAQAAECEVVRAVGPNQYGLRFHSSSMAFRRTVKRLLQQHVSQTRG